MSQPTASTPTGPEARETPMTMIARICSLALFACCAGLAATGVRAQSTVQVSGTFAGSSGSPNDRGTFSGTFSCSGSPVCTGQYSARVHNSGCSNTFVIDDALVVTGLDLALPGAIAGSMTFRNGGFNDMFNGDGTCSIRPGTSRDLVFGYTGSWDGNAGTTLVRALNTGDGTTFEIRGNFTATGVPVAFPMVVTGSIGPIVANVAATIEFRPQDLGTTASVFVFALAPSTVVRAVAAAGEPPGIMATGAKADNVACVLAQLTSTGQLQQVSASQMQAYVTKVLTGQAQAIAVLNGVPTVQISGATFFVGYGATAASMLNGGSNRRVASAPGAVRCEPQKPQAGWWWNPAEGGSGFSLEVQGSNIFFASYLYDASGRSTWLAAAGKLTLEGALFSGEKLYAYSSGQTLDGAYRAPGAPVSNGDITLAFNDSTHGTLVWPGGTIPIERFNIVADGVAAVPQQGRPESGWWWNEQEAGRGFFIEWQGGSAFLAGYMYDRTGNPLWYASLAPTPDPGRFSGAWTQYANGQTLTGGYRPEAPLATSVAPVTITFRDAQNATMTLPGGRTSTLTRFRF